MDAWDSVARPVRKGYAPQQVQEFCVRNVHWQRFRISLKGFSTKLKLTLLANWYDGTIGAPSERPLQYEREVQVGNYLGALRRGGQLDENNRIKRAL